MEIAFAVEIIEVDFGERSEGWSIYRNRQTCIRNTRAGSERGAYGGGGGYYGPRRPLCYYEVPVESLPKDIQERLKKHSKAHTENSWWPKMKSDRILIPDEVKKKAKKKAKKAVKA